MRSWGIWPSSTSWRRVKANAMPSAPPVAKKVSLPHPCNRKGPEGVQRQRNFSCPRSQGTNAILASDAHCFAANYKKTEIRTLSMTIRCILYLWPKAVHARRWKPSLTTFTARCSLTYRRSGTTRWQEAFCKFRRTEVCQCTSHTWTRSTIWNQR
jgi:hypothetical protein